MEALDLQAAVERALAKLLAARESAASVEAPKRRPAAKAAAEAPASAPASAERQARGLVSVRVGKSGCLSLYGMRRFPINLYVTEVATLRRLLNDAERVIDETGKETTLSEFVDAHDSQLSRLRPSER